MQTLFAIILMLFMAIETIRLFFGNLLTKKNIYLGYLLSCASFIITLVMMVLILINRFVVKDALVLSGGKGNFIIFIFIFIIILMYDRFEIKRYQNKGVKESSEK